HLSTPPRRLIGAGNGMRENGLLAQLVADAFNLPPAVPAHREEAAFGAALMAAVGTGVCRNLVEAGRLIRYVESATGGGGGGPAVWRLIQGGWMIGRSWAFSRIREYALIKRRGYAETNLD